MILLTLRLAMADLLGERTMSACTALAVAAVLTPLLVLAGLRAGAVENMREAVLRDPLALEVISIANSTFDDAFLAGLRARPDVAHLSPRTRQLSASLLIETADGQRNLWAQIVPSTEGDPLIPANELTAPDRVVLSVKAAAGLGARAGDQLIGRLGRDRDGKHERINLVVAAVAGPGASDKDAIFTQLAFADGLENWIEGRVELAAPGAVPVPLARAGYAGFRLYARRLENVPRLVTDLRAEGIETRSRVKDIAPMLAVDRALTRLLAAVGGISGLGLVFSLGAGLWANVERKRHLLAGLRLMGCGRGVVIAMPAIQAATLALIGVVLATLVALAAKTVINSGVGGIAAERDLAVLRPSLLLFAGLACVVVAVVASTLAASRAATIEPYEAVRGP